MVNIRILLELSAFTMFIEITITLFTLILIDKRKVIKVIKGAEL